MRYEKLNEVVRKYMKDEYELDQSKDHLYFSSRLTDEGRDRYANLLLMTLIKGNDKNFADQLKNEHMIKEKERRVLTLGGISEFDVPKTAPDELAKREFQRYYLRALCREAIDKGYKRVKIISEIPVEELPDMQKEKIGRMVSPKELLEDLRDQESRFGLPSPNDELTLDFVKEFR